MIIVKVWTDIMTDEIKVDSVNEAIELRTKIRSQMNNGNAILFGDNLINPKHIRVVSFKSIADDEA